MNQTRLVSFIETSANVASGFITAFLVWRFFVVPYLDIPVSYRVNLVVTTVFTVVSIIRGYLWRRFFNNGLHRVTLEVIRKWVQ